MEFNVAPGFDRSSSASNVAVEPFEGKWIGPGANRSHVLKYCVFMSLGVLGLALAVWNIALHARYQDLQLEVAQLKKAVSVAGKRAGSPPLQQRDNYRIFRYKRASSRAKKNSKKNKKFKRNKRNRQLRLRVDKLIRDRINLFSPTGNAIHLQGKARQTNDYAGYFQWTSDADENEVDGLINDESTGTLLVKHSGFYLIYSQVATNGRTDNSQHVPYGHHTVLISPEPHKQTKVLMTSWVTQDQRGHSYYSTSPSILYPLDTIAHMGIFYLRNGSNIAVNRTQYSQSVRYLLEPTYAHFGAILVKNV